jgi:tRNA (mo5U34)-methyltransferase
LKDFQPSPDVWWHTIELPGGEVTPGRVDYRGEKGKRFLLPEDLTRKSVLDFGTWDGFWAIEAKRRGALEVVATDRWSPPLETAAKALGAYGIHYFCTGDLDLPLKHKPWMNFDVVLFYGILYHLKNPYMGLLNAASCCKPGGLVIVESAVNQGKLSSMGNGIPLLWVIDEVHHGDPTNYFMPNEAGVLQLCRMAKLEPTEQIAVENTRFTVVCRKEVG